MMGDTDSNSDEPVTTPIKRRPNILVPQGPKSKTKTSWQTYKAAYSQKYPEIKESSLGETYAYSHGPRNLELWQHGDHKKFWREHKFGVG